VPVTIGLYAIPELIEMANAGSFAFVYGLFEKALSVPSQLFVWLGYGG